MKEGTMSYKIQTSNQPDDADLVEVDDAELIDLQRMGLVKPGKGDINQDGKLKRNVEASPEVRNATGSVPVQPTAA